MKNYEKNKISFDDFYFVGYDAQKPIYCDDTNFIIAVTKGMTYDCYDFENNEVTDTDFFMFAIKWCKKNLLRFIPRHEINKESDKIIDYVLSGEYGDKKEFYGFSIVIIPGGYIWRRESENINLFIPFEQILKEIEYRSNIPAQTRANNP
jgi:hypothetical protein